MFCIPIQWQGSGPQEIQPPRVWQATRLCKLLMMVQYKRVRIWQQCQCFVVRSYLTGKLFRNVTLCISATGLISSLSLLWKYMEVHSNAWLMFLLNLWISFEYTSNMTGWMSMTNKKDQQIKKQAQELCLRSSKMFENLSQYGKSILISVWGSKGQDPYPYQKSQLVILNFMSTNKYLGLSVSTDSLNVHICQRNINSSKHE